MHSVTRFSLFFSFFLSQKFLRILLLQLSKYLQGHYQALLCKYLHLQYNVFILGCLENTHHSDSGTTHAGE